MSDHNPIVGRKLDVGCLRYIGVAELIHKLWLLRINKDAGTSKNKRYDVIIRENDFSLTKMVLTTTTEAQRVTIGKDLNV